MKRVLITGMSGTGKSTVIEELAARGYKAVDTDYGWCHSAANGEWVWREDRIQSLLTTEDADLLFVAGTASNQVKFYPQFDHIILLSVPAEVIVARLATRTNNPFGRTSDELARVLADLRMVEPMLRRIAQHEIDTSVAIDEVVAAVLRVVEQ